VYVSSTEAHFRSTLALDGCWHRLERNLAADVAAAWSGATLTGVRGMVFHAYSASSAMWVDDVRFSNAMTVESNSLLPGAVGQIACRRAVDATNFGHTNTFYFYDHIGNVQGVSSAGGSVAETYTQDAWGNVLSSPTTGQWATSFGGRHLTTKEQDGDVGMYYFWQRWYDNQISAFMSLDPVDSWQINSRHFSAYNFCFSSPIVWHDTDGEKPSKPRYKPRRPGRPQPVLKPGPGKPIVMDPKKIAKKAGKLARGCMKAFRAITCTSCAGGLGVVEGICAIHTDNNAAWLDCLCDQINNNEALKLICNGCSVPLVGLDPTDGFSYCSDE